MSIVENVARVRERIAAAVRRAGRNREDITLMGVSKTFPVERIVEAYQAGLRVFGENRVQEFAEKTGGLRDLTDAEWHLIGHLQSNKAAKAAELFNAVDSVDSVKLAERLNAAAAKTAKTLPILIEINVGGEDAKSGVAPGSEELEQILVVAPRLANLHVRGLMTVPPYSENPEDARPFFRRLREIRDQVALRQLPAIGMDMLSMGMSHDLEVAIEEGSTCVRVGTAIFGERQNLNHGGHGDSRGKPGSIIRGYPRVPPCSPWFNISMALTKDSPSGITFAVKIHPRAKKNAITGEVGDAIKLALTAPPVDGKANNACIDFFAKLLNVPRSSVTIAAGQTSRNKIVRVVGLSAEEVQRRLVAE